MWSPTHAQVVVQKARNLRTKGKHGTNDVYVIIQLGKEKFQTSVQEKSTSPEWHEECELSIPDDNKACVTLSVYHRSLVGLDKFLGRVEIPLQDFDIYERPKNRWYALRGKPSKDDAKARGELEARVAFVVKSMTGSLMDLTKKQKKTGSLPKMMHSVGGSLMNLASKEKRASFGAKLSSVGNKISEKLPKRNRSFRSDQGSDRIDEDDVAEMDYMSVGGSDIDIVSDTSSTYAADNAANISASDFGLDAELPNKRHGGSGDGSSMLFGSSSVNNFEIPLPATPPRKQKQNPAPFPPSAEKKMKSEVLPKDHLHESKPAFNEPVTRVDHQEVAKTSPAVVESVVQPVNDSLSVVEKSEPPLKSHIQLNSARRQNQGKAVPSSTPKADGKSNSAATANKETQDRKLLAYVSKEKLQLFDVMTKQELVEVVCKQQFAMEKQQKQIKDLEDYIDNLLVRVMETTPRLLQNPFKIGANQR